MALSISTNGPIQVNLAGNFTFTDLTNVQAPLSKIIPQLLANMTASSFGQATIGTTLIPVTLPITPTQLAYARNLSQSNTLTISWTPLGGVSAVITTLQPNGIIFFFNPSSGISALSVVSNAAGTLIDYVLAG